MPSAAPTPDAPWRQRADWAAGEVHSHGWRAIGLHALTTLAVNAIGWGVWLAVYFDRGKNPAWALWWVGIFPAIGIAMLAALIYAVLRQLRFGTSVFRMSTTPGVVGGELAGVVLAPEGLRPADGFELKLVCTRTYWRKERRGKERERRTSPIYEAQCAITRTLHDPSGRVGMPVRFVIPSDAEESSPDAAEPIHWKLYVRGKCLGPDYKAVFDVPVYLTDDSQDGVVSTPDPLPDYQRKESLEDALARERIHLTREGSSHNGVPARVRLVCPPARQLGMTLMLLLVAVGLGAALAVFVVGSEGWLRVALAALLGFVLGLPTLVCALGALDSLLKCSRLEVDGDQWRSRTGWLGLRWRERRFASSQVEKIVAKQTGSSRGDEGTTRWSEVTVHLKDGQRATVATNIRNAKTLETLLTELRRVARLTEAPPAGRRD